MAGTAVKMTVQWFVPIGESRSIATALHQVMIAARANRGCLGCSVTTNVGQEVGVTYVEEWADEDLLRRELRSSRFCTLAALMEHATRVPSVEFEVPGGTRTLEYVTEVRASASR